MLEEFDNIMVLSNKYKIKNPLLLMKTLEDLKYKLCEKLPGDSTIFGEDGMCSINSGKCSYSSQCNANVSERKIVYSCNKKTYIFKPIFQ